MVEFGMEIAAELQEKLDPGVLARYREWLESPCFDDGVKAELVALAEAGDCKEIEDRFYCDLEFGTGGMRGRLGAGTNRMNVYIIRRLTAALGAAVCEAGVEAKRRGVVISYDSRRFSERFAKEAALTLAAAGVKAWLFDALRPTPVLSFAVREKGAIAGIMITASHNPKEYNGYKVYWEDGGQLPPEQADKIVVRMEAQNGWEVPLADEAEAVQNGLLEMIGAEIDAAYELRVKEQMLNPELTAAKGAGLDIVYTPLHGTGRVLVERILAANGFVNVHEVVAQAEPDSEFSTVAVPNPEDDGAWQLAIGLAEDIEKGGRTVDLLLATDPDADRLGVCCRRSDGGWQRLSGNQAGVLLAYYIINSEREQGILPADGVVIKSVVSTALADQVVKGLGVKLKNVPVGFKFIGEQIKEMETGSGTFIFGFEESLGYLKGTYARDKDAVLAAALVAEAALYYRERGKRLTDVLEEIYSEYGCYLDAQVACTLGGIDGRAEIAEIMRILRADERQEIGGMVVASREFYERGEQKVGGEVLPFDFPHADMLGLTFSDGSFIKVRPSGTEPKIRFYFCIAGRDMAVAEANMQLVRREFLQPVERFIG